MSLTSPEQNPKRRPNVLLMVDSFDMGGAETQTLLLARLLLEDGRYGVHLACLRREGILLPEVERLGIGEVPEFRLTSFYDFNMMVQLKRFISFLRERQIDVVHPQSFYTNVFAITGAALARVPARIAFRGETAGWRTRAQDFVERCAYRLATAIHANSEAVRGYLVEKGVNPRKIFTVYNGLDMNRVAVGEGSTREDLLRKHQLEKLVDRQFVTIVANMHHEVKDHKTFLRAAAVVAKQCPNAVFLLIGDGQLRDGLRLLADELGLTDKALFVGQHADVAELLFVSDVCVLSSTAEGFSNSILEYMAAAKPVVATAVGGAPEAIAEGESGYLVSPGDSQRMGEIIASLLNEPDKARAMGLRGRQIVQERFSTRAQLTNTEQLYDHLLSSQRNGTTPDHSKLGQKGAVSHLS